MALIIHPNNQPVRYSDSNLDTIRRDMDSLINLVKKLSKQIAELPKVNSKGESECQFVDQLFEKKENTEGIVKEKLKVLKGKIFIIDSLLKDHNYKLHQIQKNRIALELDRNRQSFSLSEMTQSYHIKSINQLKNELLGLFEWAQQVITIAGAKQLPGNKQKKKKYHHSGSIHKTEQSVSLPVELSKRGEVENLLNMGAMPGNMLSGFSLNGKIDK